MEPIKIKSGPMEVIASGSVIAYKNNPIELILGSKEEIRLILKFKNVDNKDKQEIVGKSIDSRSLELTLSGLDNNLGVWNTNPLPIGVFHSRELYLNFRFYAQQEDRLLQFTLYLGEKREPVDPSVAGATITDSKFLRGSMNELPIK